jgi:hypothetical protein
MRNMVKAAIAGLAALSIAGSVLATTEPVAAQQWHGGGWHGGGWQGGGWHGGGWHGGGWRRGGWHGGAGWWGPAVVGGLAAGALLAAPYYSNRYGGSCYAYTQVTDAYGNYIGRQLVNVC